MLNLSEPGQILKYEMSLYIYATPLLAHLFKDIQLISHCFSPSERVLIIVLIPLFASTL